MDIAIVGSGRIGGRLARAWAKAGHAVVIGTREPNGDRSTHAIGDSPVRVAGIEDAARGAEVVVLAVPYAAIGELVPLLAPVTNGKVIIDTANAILRPPPTEPGGAVVPQLRYPPSTSAAEDLAARLPGARIVKAFNAQGAEIIDQPSFDGVAASNFYCGDDPDAKRIAAALIADAGFDPVDLGPLRSARQLEMLTLLWFEVTAASGTRDVAFRVLRR